MENPIRCETFKSDNPTISSTYSKNAQKLVESMTFSDGDIVMDYGCGSGQFMSEFLFPKIPQNDHSIICGVDSPQMIRFAYENCKNKKENLYFASGDIMNKYQWTFKENMVNKFVAYQVLCYVQDYRSFFSKVFDFLRPSGQLGVLAPFSQVYGITENLLSQDKWAQYAEKSEVNNKSTFAPWTYDEDKDVPSRIQKSLEESGFQINQFQVEEINLEFPTVRNLCEFLCTLTSALTTVPEKLHDEFIQEMMDFVTVNLGSKGLKKSQPVDESNANSSMISVEWRFLNFVATKKA